MRMLILAIMVLVCDTVNAEVFKCIGNAGKTVYQEKPCQTAVKSQQLDIKGDPAKEAEAKAKLEALQTENDARRAERLKAEKEAAAQRNQAEQTDALKRSAFAQQQQATAQQRQAEALEKQNQQLNNPVWVLPPVARPLEPHSYSPEVHADHDSEHRSRHHRQEDGKSTESPVPTSTPPPR
ncbi:MAG: DUF4124 domain-containing protein [Methylococcaceae bacterium]|nr:DUF4124 domain-containing protein [Methylococcaceae bacterium]